MNDADRRRGEPVRQHPDEGLHLTGPDRGQLALAQRGIDVPAQHRLDMRCRGRPVDLGGAPLFAVLVHRPPPRPRVDVGPGHDRRRDPVQPALRVDLPREVPGVLDALPISVTRTAATLGPFGDVHLRPPDKLSLLGFVSHGAPTTALLRRQTDPLARQPVVCFQHVQEPQPGHGRIRVDVWVPHDHAEARVSAALADVTG